ncbi:DUF6519 domain-containing protein [Nitrosomonas sp.]|uniref:DUF6519 domain-containing protein n=1 Tax=Nitrosomonas sp. TaxID=42353 RepID=UPI0025D6EF41|nr:DUF6519 domain-containing protein [Nitrosomonas sp.]
MKGDFTRDTFDKAKHFSRVLQQQGRVQLDADTNEQTAILLHYIRTLAADLIGPFAGPAGAGLGFSISLLDDSINKDNPDFLISQGRYYVDGILCEKDEDKLNYQAQECYPNPPVTKLSEGDAYLIYLDVWERHISSIDDDSIREKALGGPDTASRAKIISQVKLQSPVDKILFPVKKGNDLELKDWKELVEIWQPSSSGCLKVQVKPSEIPNSPCAAAPDTKYRGPENQLYRVEIHNSGNAGEATFKWSRDNGSVATRIVDGTFAGTTCKVESSKGFESGIWVELSNEERELRGEPGALVKLVKVENDVFTLESATGWLSNSGGKEKTSPTKVRRWDQTLNSAGTSKIPDGAVVITESSDSTNGWINLENEVQIQFQPTAAEYRTGDYWLIPARVETRDIEWPVIKDNGNVVPISKPPFGIRHHYAPLALLSKDGAKWKLISLQTEFPPVHKVDGEPGLSSLGEEGFGGHLSCKQLEKVNLVVKKA